MPGEMHGEMRCFERCVRCCGMLVVREAKAAREPLGSSGRLHRAARRCGVALVALARDMSGRTRRRNIVPSCPSLECAAFVLTKSRHALSSSRLGQNSSVRSVGGTHDGPTEETTPTPPTHPPDPLYSTSGIDASPIAMRADHVIGPCNRTGRAARAGGRTIARPQRETAVAEASSTLRVTLLFTFGNRPFQPFLCTPRRNVRACDVDSVECVAVSEFTGDTHRFASIARWFRRDARSRANPADSWTR